MTASASNPADRRYYQQYRPEVAAFIPPRRQRVLEIGCAEGNFISSLTGVEEKWGVESDPSCARIARTRIDRVLEGLFEDVQADLPRAYFDVVICNDVIEHMPDHDRFLQAIKVHIAPGGVLVGSVPNVRYHRNFFELLVLRDWHYRESGVLDRTHLRFFTLRSWQRNLIENGYHIEQLSLMNPFMPWRWTKWDMVYFLAGAAMIVGAFGFYRDVRYIHFGFRASP